jgi:hypothetical protein
MESWLSTVQVESEQWSTPHTKHKLEKKKHPPLSPSTHKKEMKAPSLNDATSHWLHENSIPKISLELIA